MRLKAVVVMLAVGRLCTLAGQLSPNAWTQVDAGGGGVRRGAAVAWLAEERKFLVVGGALENKKKHIPRPSTLQTFDPATRTWAAPCTRTRSRSATKAMARSSTGSRSTSRPPLR